MTDSNQPLFIACPGRSFSSVVCAVIGQHPDALGLPELNLFRWPTIGDLLDVATPSIGMPSLATGIRRTLAELMFGAQTDETVAEVNVWLDKRRSWTGHQMFEEVRRLADPRFVVEKSPTNTDPEALGRIAGAYPEARYLHLSRHPRSTGRSQHQAVQKTQGAMRAVKRFWTAATDHEARWLTKHKQLLDLSTRLRPDQYLFLQGEWFLENPDLVIPQICEWLDIPCDDDILARMKRPEDSPFSKPGPAGAPTGANLGFLEDPVLRVGKVKEERLDGPLEWGEGDDLYYGDELIQLAHILGYRS